jgi:hypothetical protein
MDLEGPSTNKMSRENAASQSPQPVSYTEIESIIRMAMTAPSGDNCQPWRFTWNDETLAVFYEEQLGHHALNNCNHATWLSLGCLVESIGIAASGFRLRAHTRLNFENWQSQPMGVIYFTREQMCTDPLISEIFRRKTDRNLYHTTPLPETVIQQLKHEAVHYPGLHFSYKQGTPNALAGFVGFCDEYMWSNRRIASDFLHWVRLSDKEETESKDGMSWKSLGIQKADLFPLRLFRRLPFLISWLWKLGFQKKVNQTTKRSIQALGGVYSIAVTDTQPAAVVSAGKLAFRLWLLLNSEGYAVQPMSLPSLTAFDVATGHAPPNTEASALQRFKAGYQELKAYFGFAENQWPVWMFRTGRAIDPNLAPITPRVRVQDRLKVYTRDLPRV